MGDAQALAEQIMELANNPNLETLAQNSKVYFDANFEKQKLMDIVDSLLNLDQ